MASALRHRYGDGCFCFPLDVSPRCGGISDRTTRVFRLSLRLPPDPKDLVFLCCLHELPWKEKLPVTGPAPKHTNVNRLHTCSIPLCVKNVVNLTGTGVLVIGTYVGALCSGRVKSCKDWVYVQYNTASSLSTSCVVTFKDRSAAGGSLSVSARSTSLWSGVEEGRRAQYHTLAR